MKKILRWIVWLIVLILLGLFIYYFYPELVSQHFGLSHKIKQITNSQRYRHASWGILAQDLQTGRVIQETNSAKLFIPASTTKLFTAATALDSLGADHHFVTPLYYQGKISQSGTLAGSLILVASGDITMGGRRQADNTMAYTSIDHTDANSLNGATLTEPNPLAGLNYLAERVKRSGINRIRGEVLIDDRMFKTQPPPSPADYLLSPIMINDNLIDFTVKPTKVGQPAKITWRPQTKYFTVKSAVDTVKSGIPSKLAIFSPKPGLIKIQGQISVDQPQLVRAYAVKNPAAFARALLIEALERAGVKVYAGRGGKLPDDYSKLRKVAQLTSLPFSEYVKMILKVSHNPGADTLLFLIANQHGKQTMEDGLAIEKNFLTRAGVDLNGVFLGDGQGGVREDLISPKAVVQLLKYMSKSNNFSVFRGALPILGVDGSLADMAASDSPVRGKVQAKTGTSIAFVPMNGSFFLNAKGLAGYMVTNKGRELAFATYVNNVDLAGAKDLGDLLHFVTVIGTQLGQINQAIYLEN